MKIKEYFEMLENKVNINYSVANEARAKGIDPVSKVEVPQASSLAEKVVGLVSAVYPQIQNKKIVQRILELEKKYGSLDPAVALSIAEEIAREKFCKLENHHQAMEAGVRVAIAYMTLGVVSSPIEGFVELKINKTKEGEDYFSPYYSGPIRSAGGTESAFSLIILDHLREIFGYSKYDPSEDEIKRGVHECYEYHERVTNLQYLPTEEELEYLMKHIPIQVSGDPSEKREVYNYKDLPRVETNFIRSGFTLVMGEGIAQKAPKILKRINSLKKNGFKLSAWDWMEDFVKLQKSIKEGEKDGSSSSGAVYIQDIVAGRPVFAHPSESGSFRLRYGRCRNTGYSSLGFSPSTMAITKDFIAVGTQLKIEKPTKGCTAASCDSIDGPIVKLKNGSVKFVQDVNKAKELAREIEEIIYLGDILVPYGDFLNRNHNLCKPAYVEQYWLEEVLEKGGKSELFPKFEDALKISENLRVALHPFFTYYWNQISYEEFLSLVDWLAHGKINSNLILPYGKIDKERFSKAKRSLELIGCEHEVTLENVVLNEKDSKSLLFNLGIDIGTIDLEKDFDKLSNELSPGKKVLELINSFCKFTIKDKSGTFVGARMGRPEKAKLRKLVGSPHVLFPVGSEGGRLRSVIAATEVGSVFSNFPVYYCSNCKSEGIYPLCEICNSFSKKMNYCRECDVICEKECPKNHERLQPFRRQRLDILKYFNSAKKHLGLRLDDLPVVIKGVRETKSDDRSCESLAKGLLRAKYNLNVNKDGTIRYDISEMPITHFKPLEVGTPIEKLRELGYEKDIYGKDLKNEEQILEIFPHDVILPACPDTPDQKADDVFFNISKFVDDELKYIYKNEKFFNFESKKDLPGALLGCMAPHNCAAVVGRLIGFSKVQALLASPYMHAAMRRDCDGDEAAVMLLMDLLVNFSKKFLPSHRGGTQDAPLVLNTRMRAGEVDDMIFDVDVGDKIPLELFKAAEEEKAPWEVKMEQVSGRLGGKHEFDNLMFSYDTSDINKGPRCSSYKTLPTMKDKVAEQMDLCKKIRAVDTSDVARLVIERHFIRDIKGNLRKFSQQTFRCVGCNEKYRRPPLAGKCLACGGKLIFTISQGSIMKYLQASLDLARTYNVSPYLLENMEIIEKDIESIFGKDKEKQSKLFF